ncbi:SCO1664 family protein [Nakamurella leprariae]|uniref:SCO1664 family protein n=1 Tax=Nakamurella leprariae TaxID=2803911 RepID=A0A938Y8S5_9ACTN|nr:SCO1664 family protein [Nakamurella leprariae]
MPEAPSEDVRRLLTEGDLDITGRLSDASNVTLLATASLDGQSVQCIYKPVRGERPLWDFPDGTLAEREYASYLLSEAAGWHCVPLTLLRPGPLGAGMVQVWIEDADPDLVVDLLPVKRVPADWISVFRAVDYSGDDVAVAHADEPRLAVLAGFDAVANNADRKGSHILPTADGRIYGVDHGLCLHQEDKLRTILWGFAGRKLPAAVADGLERLSTELDGTLGEQLDELITTAERRALDRRLHQLLQTRRFPKPPGHRNPIPWPPL